MGAVRKIWRVIFSNSWVKAQYDMKIYAHLVRGFKRCNTQSKILLKVCVCIGDFFIANHEFYKADTLYEADSNRSPQIYFPSLL